MATRTAVGHPKPLPSLFKGGQLHSSGGNEQPHLNTLLWPALSWMTDTAQGQRKGPSPAVTCNCTKLSLSSNCHEQTGRFFWATTPGSSIQGLQKWIFFIKLLLRVWCLKVNFPPTEKQINAILKGHPAELFAIICYCLILPNTGSISVVKSAPSTLWTSNKSRTSIFWGKKKVEYLRKAAIQ